MLGGKVEEKILLIEWEDAKGVTGEWEFKKNIGELRPSLCFTIGFCVEETEDYITVAQTVSKDQVCGRITIPRGIIKKTIDLGKLAEEEGQ